MTSVSGLLGAAGMVLAGIGIFVGFYLFPSRPGVSLAIVTTTCVGVVGLLAFVRHVVFFRSDAARLGWATERPDWQFEVGFANLAFGLMGFLAGLGMPGPRVQAVVLIGYAAYLAQAALLHLYRYLTDAERSPGRLWRSVVGTLLFAGMLSVFAARALRGGPG